MCYNVSMEQDSKGQTEYKRFNLGLRRGVWRKVSWLAAHRETSTSALINSLLEERLRDLEKQYPALRDI